MKFKKSQQQVDSTKKPTILRNVEDLSRQMQPVQLEIARRSYELFEERGCEQGHDWEDWFRAESELLRPVSIVISESDDRIHIRANVLGFEEKDLSASIAPRRVTIFGKKQVNVTESEGGKLEYIDWSPDLIMTFVDLPADVTPEESVVEFEAGLLKFELSKTARRHKANSAVIAA